MFPEDDNNDQPYEAIMTEAAEYWLTQISREDQGERKVVVQDQEEEEEEGNDVEEKEKEAEMEMMVEWNRMEVCDTRQEEEERLEHEENTAKEVAIPTCLRGNAVMGMADKVLLA